MSFSFAKETAWAMSGVSSGAVKLSFTTVLHQMAKCIWFQLISFTIFVSISNLSLIWLELILHTASSTPRGTTSRHFIFADDKPTFSGEGFFIYWSELPAAARIVLLAPCAPHFGTPLLGGAASWMPLRLPWRPLCRCLPELTSQQLTRLHAPTSSCPHSLNRITLFLKPFKIY